MVTERSFHSRRNPWFGRIIIAAGSLVVLGAASYSYRSHLAEFPLIRTIPFGFVVTNYPIRIALRTPLPIGRHTQPADAIVERREVGGPLATEDSPELDHKLPMTLPVQPNDGEKGLTPIPEGLQDQAAIGALGDTRLLKLNYSIAGEARDKVIAIQKKIIIDGTEEGLAELRIADGSQILIRSSDLARFEASKFGSIVIGVLRKSEYVNFDELRSLGLMIRYDAVHDRVLVSSEST